MIQTRTTRSVRPTVLQMLLAGVLLALIAASANAIVFTVTLSNGTTFETRYRPIVAEWDENYVMLRTDQGNWISLAKDEVADVTTAAESSGFGYQLNETTLYMGFTPGDIMLEDDEGEGGGRGVPPAAPDDSAITYGGSTGGYGLDQFLDIPQNGTINSQPLTGVGGD